MASGLEGWRALPNGALPNAPIVGMPGRGRNAKTTRHEYEERRREAKRNEEMRRRRDVTTAPAPLAHASCRGAACASARIGTGTEGAQTLSPPPADGCLQDAREPRPAGVRRTDEHERPPTSLASPCTHPRPHAHALARTHAQVCERRRADVDEDEREDMEEKQGDEKRQEKGCLAHSCIH